MALSRSFPKKNTAVFSSPLNWQHCEISAVKARDDSHINSHEHTSGQHVLHWASAVAELNHTSQSPGCLWIMVSGMIGHSITHGWMLGTHNSNCNIRRLAGIQGEAGIDFFHIKTKELLCTWRFKDMFKLLKNQF